MLAEFMVSAQVAEWQDAKPATPEEFEAVLDKMHSRVKKDRVSTSFARDYEPVDESGDYSRVSVTVIPDNKKDLMVCTSKISAFDGKGGILTGRDQHTYELVDDKIIRHSMIVEDHQENGQRKANIDDEKVEVSSKELAKLSDFLDTLVDDSELRNKS